MSGDPRLTRRAVLLAGIAVPLAACRDTRKGRGGDVRTPHVEETDLVAALQEERTLLAEYDAAIAGSVATGGLPYSILRATHATHVEALTAALGRSPASAGPSPTPSATLTARELRLREAVTGNTLTTAAIRASDGGAAALLASIAASHLAQSHMNFHRSGKQ